MNSYHQLKELFQSALDRDPGQRAEFLQQACDGDAVLRAEVEEMLAAYEQDASFLEAPAFAVGAELLADGQTGLMVGRRIGPYKVLREIGHGGMGAVYLAVRDDDQFRQQVAIKLIRSGLDSDFIIHRFRQERQILAQLAHPYIARLLDGGTTETGCPYFVMEYIEGQPVDAYCDRHQLSTAERLKLFRLVCAAVHYAHQNLIVHRDIKPRNLLVTEEGVPKLLDFGIAKLLNPELTAETSDHTATVLRLMTPDYASPEQVRGEPITTASDVYSLGVLLYELLTGHRPYRIKSRSPSEIARIICEQEPEKPSTVVSRIEEVAGTDGAALTTLTPESVSGTRDGQPDKLRRRLSGDLDNIVLKAMRKEPERRYASVEQFAEDLRRHLEGLPVMARKDTFSYRSGKFIRRHKAGVAAAALVVLTLMAGIVATAWEARVAAKQARLAVEQRDKARTEAAKAERIKSFLQDVLSYADPYWYSPGRGQGRDVKVVEALNAAAQRIDTELNDQPEVKAEIHQTIGNTYRALALYDAAERHFRAALKLRRELYGEEHLKVAESLYFLGAAIQWKGDLPAAESYYQQALAIQRKLPGGDNVYLPHMVSACATMRQIQKGNDEATEALFREALNLFRKHYGEEHFTVAAAYVNLGGLYFQRGDLDEARARYQQALDISRKFFGGPSLETAGISRTLAVVLTEQGEYTAAEALIRPALELERRTLGENHPRVAESLRQLAILLCAKRDYVRAEAEVRRAIDIERRLQLVGGPGVGVADSLNLLGAILTKAGQPARAETYLREALKIRPTLPKGDLGECLMAQKRYAEAEALLVESYQSLKASQVERSPRTAEALRRLVRLYEAWGKPEMAARYTARGQR